MSFFPTFTNPIAFIGLLGIGLLYLAYRQAKSSKRIEVPSLFFIKQLKLPKRATSKRKLPLRFFIESIIITLLVLYLSSPELRPRVKTIAVFFDVSQSMGTTNSNSVSRITEGKKKLASFLDSQPGSNSYFLFTAPSISGSSIQITPKENELLRLSREDLKKKVDTLRPFTFPDSLESRVKELTETLLQKKVNEVVIISDKRFTGSIHKDITLRSIQVGTQEVNAYISSARTRNSTNGTVEVEMGYGLSGTGSATATFTIKEISPNEKELLKFESVIQGGTEKIETVSLGNSLLKRSAILKIELSLNPLRDSLESDNEIFLVHQAGEGKSSILFISPSINSHKKHHLSLESALGQNITHMESKDFLLLEPKERNSYTLEIHYKTTPPPIIINNTLIILPNRENSIIPIRTTVESPSITSWDQNHHITRYLKVPLLAISNAILFNRTSWGNAIISTSQGPLLIAGAIDNKKLIVSGFELLPFEGNRNKVSSILLLNILRSLQSFEEGREISNFARQDIKDLTQLIPGIFEENEAPSFLENGIYRGILPDNKDRSVFSIQNFFQEESDTFSRIHITLEEEEIRVSNIENINISIYLLYFVLLLIFLDLMLIVIFRKEIE
jgi:hypothetical protein